MGKNRSILGSVWKVLVAGIVYAVGAILGGGLVALLGLELPRFPMEVDPAVQLPLLFAGGVAMAAGLAAIGAGIAGRWWEKWAVVALFVFVVNGVGNALEGSIFTTLGSQGALLLSNTVAGVLCALAVSLLFPAPPGSKLAEQVRAIRSRWRSTRLLGRLFLALLAFPLFYFFFGAIIAPIVVPHYQQLDFLIIPPMPTMLTVLLVRSAMFLVVSLLVIAAWRGSRLGLIIALGLAHFVTVGFAGLIQTTFFPAVLRWTHSIEILADSMFYAWALVWLLVPRPLGRKEESPEVAQTVHARAV
ncbi:MAG: hypothetical protein OES47_07315 [Acidobacteriota bacterium]|nr:hypothetical protein [Acidobacteriota bacterium]